jgi:hypothetical protein
MTTFVNVRQEKSPGLGTAGFVCGLLALIFAFVPLLNLVFTPILGILGLVFGGVGERQAVNRGAPGGLSLAGAVLGAASLLALVIVYGALFA